MILGKKLGMTQIYSAAGDVIPVTVVLAGPCIVTQINKQSIQVGFEEAKKLNKPETGHLKDSKDKKLKNLKEFKVEKPEEYKLGQEIKADFFKEGDHVKVSGISIGKGTAGTIKRHHFHRSAMSHGSKSHRLPGSIGAGTTPGRVEKGTRMSGRLGNKRITVENLEIVQVDVAKNLILIKGAIPGAGGNVVEIVKI